ncbi:hypothetical protein CBB_2097 [Clostridium botulinum Bf]|uniref:Uncharacterized protein n=2 Tax=Clostridium botulinum TaxID=1491 RepID=C1FP40_CLOBJ|nr:conserved hypothetical protein [Clostridium botulinum A2 str. Kyoto]ACQ54876.1 hypothetical protein CLJ_B2041 [Clostridium botulinum Ba4 str. 657]EDT80799.1 hypothetical protein CBN_1918 [Clostridium botulinum NCTC 2916]EDT84305.1 hypothetical protein CBB_2097 [Clostridium botulinum Bf]
MTNKRGILLLLLTFKNIISLITFNKFSKITTDEVVPY